MNNAFNPKEFAILLKKLIGPRQVQDFASQVGVSRFQVSRRLAAALDTPPRKKTLKQFASYASNGVTYEDLLKCAGYPVDDTFTESPVHDKGIKIAKACLLSAISELQLPVRPSQDTPEVDCDFALIIGNDPEVAWNVSCLPSDMPVPLAGKTVKDRLQKLMYLRLAAYTKFSFLTDSRKIYETSLAYAPVNLNVNISVILYSPEDLEIISEGMLCRCISFPIPKEYELRKTDGPPEAE